MSRRNSSVVAVDVDQARRVSLAMHDAKQVTADANRATESEQNMTLRQGIQLYPKAIAWSVLLLAMKMLSSPFYSRPARAPIAFTWPRPITLKPNQTG